MNPYRSSSEDLSRLFVIGDGGRPISLGSVAEVRQGVGTGDDRAEVSAAAHQRSPPSPSGRDLGGHWRWTLEDKLKALPLPRASASSSPGQIQQQREAFGSLKFTLAPRHHFVYMVHGPRSSALFSIPFIIMFSVPLGMIGVIWALFLTGTTLNVTSFMGIIMMVGIVVSNGVFCSWNK
jgi:HAE1 family hydrophobic/amphiphilic exporter-1